MIIAKFIAVVIIGYLLGSIPFGVLIGRRVAKVDVRNYGSGKIGTTNVLRVAGKKAAALVIILDIAKGGVAVLLARHVFGEYLLIPGSDLWWRVSAPAAAALAAMAGHNWSVFLKFQGGRGVATFFGGLIALCPVAALFGGEMVVMGAGLTRFVSLGSIAGAVGTYTVLMPLTILHGFPIEYLSYTLIGTIAIIVMHRDNIGRLLAGKERKLGEKAEKVGSPPSKSMG
ncbi:MAG: glycerol-3-phosphate 1-O-acyltransferase PlsY [Chloroflexota bacterium]